MVNAHDQGHLSWFGTHQPPATELHHLHPLWLSHFFSVGWPMHPGVGGDGGPGEGPGEGPGAFLVHLALDGEKLTPFSMPHSLFQFDAEVALLSPIGVPTIGD